MEVFSSRRDPLKKPTFYLLGYTPKGAISVPRTRLNECLMPRVVPPHEQHKAAVALLKDQRNFLTYYPVGGEYRMLLLWRLLIESICCCLLAAAKC